MSTLKLCPVVFDEAEHTYTYNGKQLSGITAIINKYITPDKYKGVSEEVLNSKAEYGSEVHKQLEMHFTGMVVDNPYPEVTKMIELVKEAGLSITDTEYLVSDEENVASSIDAVCEDCSLIDWKTTAKLDKLSLSWQLSIYAYLFEQMNDVKVPHLYSGWIRKKEGARLTEIERISDVRVKALIQAYVDNAEVFNDPANFEQDDEESRLITDLSFMLDRKKQLLAEVESIDEEIAKTEAWMQERMSEHGIVELKRDGYTVKYTPASSYEKTVVNTDKLFEDHPELKDSYKSSKTVNTKATIKFKFDNE